MNTRPITNVMRLQNLFAYFFTNDCNSLGNNSFWRNTPIQTFLPHLEAELEVIICEGVLMVAHSLLNVVNRVKMVALWVGSQNMRIKIVARAERQSLQCGCGITAIFSAAKNSHRQCSVTGALSCWKSKVPTKSGRTRSTLFATIQRLLNSKLS